MLAESINRALLNELRKKVKYDYKIIDTPNIDDISENGWELVTIIDYNNNASKNYKMIFKKLLFPSDADRG